MNRNKWEKQWSEIVAKAWADDDFKNRLFSDPKKVLKEHGIDLPEMAFKIHENKGNVIHLVLPKKPDQTLSEHDLKKVVGAKLHCCVTSACF